MTLSIAWIRKVGSIKELVVATDSRLTSGKAWDCCPKIKILNRGDSVLCFAGETDYSYPMLEQIATSVNTYPKHSCRATDLTDVRGHILRLITNMREFLHNSIEKGKIFKPDPPKTNFILAGYSWKFDKFCIWELKYSSIENAYIHQSPKTLMKNDMVILLDAANHLKTKDTKLTVNKIRKRIFDKMVSNGKKSGDGMDMEPFEVLRDIIRAEEDWAIGGTPQVVKVYKHMNVMPYGIFWPNKDSKQVTFMGRPLMNYETLKYPIIDPDTFELSLMKIDNDEFELSHDDGRFEKYREIKNTSDK